MAALVFWGAALLLLHTYLFYPLILVALDGADQLWRNLRQMRGRGLPAPAPAASCPPVSLVVAAFDEAGCIGQKLSNSLALDYPADRFQVIVGSDGSTDGTDEI